VKAKDFRKKAWAACKGNWGNLILVLVINFALIVVCGLIGIILGRITRIIITLLFYPTIAQTIEGYVTSLSIILIYGHIIYGEAVFFSNFMRDGSEQVGDLFSGFKKYGKVFKLYFLIQLYTTLWSMLYFIPGIIRGIAYSMSYYIMNDNPDMTPKEVIKHSIKITDGYKGKYFCLQISFIGWLLLCILSLGILTIWIAPVIAASNAAFYEYVKTMYEQSLNENTQEELVENFIGKK
jgi:uncharacterized membrane protein